MTGYLPSIAEILGDRDVFFGQYFNRAPLLRRSALRGDPGCVLSVADLDAVVCAEAIRPPYLDVAKDGKQVPSATYTEPVVVQGLYLTDRVVPARIASLFRSGATLTFNALNHHRPNLRQLAARLTEAFGSPAEVIAFLTPSTRRGLAPHYDPVDVFVVQLAGTKSWRVWPVPHPRRGDDAGNLDEMALGEPAIAATLEPGDVLYIPYNCAHVATAGEQVSLHLSLTVQPRRWASLLQEVVTRITTANPAYWVNPNLRDEATPGQLRAMLEALAADLLAVDTAAEAAQLIDAGIARADGTTTLSALADAAAADAIEPSTILTRDAGCAVEVIGHDGDAVRASVNGAVYTLPHAVIAALAELDGDVTCTAASLLPGSGPDRSTRTARTLARIGVLRALR